MVRLLIDPPVNPLSSKAEIKGWIARLVHMRKEHAGDNEAIRNIDHSLALAKEWLNWKS